jgi:hypothetical protein
MTGSCAVLRCRYFIWWWVTICAVAFTVWYEPYVMAFAQYPGLEPPWGLQAWMEYLMIAIFATDMLVTFHVAYYDNEVGRVLVWLYASLVGVPTTCAPCSL